MTTRYCEMCDLWMKTRKTACPECGYPLMAAKRRGDRLAIVRTILVTLPIGLALWVGIFRCGAAVLHAQSGPQTALILGSSLDAASTLYALQNPKAHEANPILAQGGTVGFLAGKVATTAA